jgi:hypothetical protein
MKERTAAEYGPPLTTKEQRFAREIGPCLRRRPALSLPTGEPKRRAEAPGRRSRSGEQRVPTTPAVFKVRTGLLLMPGTDHARSPDQFASRDALPILICSLMLRRARSLVALEGAGPILGQYLGPVMALCGASWPLSRVRTALLPIILSKLRRVRFPFSALLFFESGSSAVVKRHLVAVGVCERESTAERPSTGAEMIDAPAAVRASWMS